MKQRKDEEQKLRIDPLPEDPTARRLLAYFDYSWGHLRARPRKYTKIKWKTEKRYRIDKRNLWKDWKSTEYIIGIGFEKTTRRVMLDIDRGSPYHPANNEDKYQKLLESLEDIGLCKPVLGRSSHSEGYHLYYYFKEEMATFKVAQLLKMTLEGKGFEIEDGKLEIFPNTKQYKKEGEGFSNYKPHRLPLQPGTGSWLVSPWSLEPIEGGDSLEKLAEMVEWSAEGNDLHQVKQMMVLMEEEDNKTFWKSLRSRRKVSGMREHLRKFIEEGWTGYHQTNVMLMKIGMEKYLFEGLEGEVLIERMEEEAKSCKGYRKWCRHQHEIERRCREWGKCIENFYVRFFKQPKRGEKYKEVFEKVSKEKPNGNERKKSEAKSRIKGAYEHLKEMEELPRKIVTRVTAIIECSKRLYGEGISKTTLYKEENLGIWHPKYEEIEKEEEKELREEEVESEEKLKEGREEGEEKIVHREVSLEKRVEEECKENPTLLKVVQEKGEEKKDRNLRQQEGLEDLLHTMTYMKGLGKISSVEKKKTSFSGEISNQEKIKIDLKSKSLEEIKKLKCVFNESLKDSLKDSLNTYYYHLIPGALKKEEKESLKLEQREIPSEWNQPLKDGKKEGVEKGLKLGIQSSENRWPSNGKPAPESQQVPITWNKAQVLLNDFFVKSMKEISEDLTKEEQEIITEYMKVTRKRMKLKEEAKKKAKIDYDLDKGKSSSGKRYETREEYEINARIDLFRKSGIEILERQAKEIVRLMNIF